MILSSKSRRVDTLLQSRKVELPRKQPRLFLKPLPQPDDEVIFVNAIAGAGAAHRPKARGPQPDKPPPQRRTAAALRSPIRPPASAPGCRPSRSPPAPSAKFHRDRSDFSPPQPRPGSVPSGRAWETRHRCHRSSAGSCALHSCRQPCPWRRCPTCTASRWNPRVRE